MLEARWLHLIKKISKRNCDCAKEAVGDNVIKIPGESDLFPHSHLR